MERKKMPLGMVVGRLMHEMFRVLRKQSVGTSDVKLTGEQFGLLHVINMKKETCVQQDLANMMGKDKSAILRLIDTLEEKKLVIRVVDSTDRRKNCLHVTDFGKEVIQQYIEMEAIVSKELTAGISDNDMDTFYRVISTIRTNAERL
jgi:MarR family transcriptional regulator, transcriptional regulator for hemolysin